MFCRHSRIMGVYLEMLFRNAREKRRVFKFLAEARSDKKVESNYRVDELHFHIKPEIELSSIIIYCLDLKHQGLIKRSAMRQNAYRISEAGRVYYKSSFWSRLNDSQRITMIGITISSILILLGFYLRHIKYI